jgi:DNA invertase Pin-like site-specific DNA recombinase
VSHEIRLRAGIHGRLEPRRSSAATDQGRLPPRVPRDGEWGQDRAQLRRAIAALEPGDVLTVTRLDRLARSTRDLLNTLDAITGKKAGFRSLADAWADTTTAHGRLMLTVLGGLAEFERELIRARTSEGRARAKANGKSLGRPHKLTAHQQREAIKRRDNGEAVREIARSFNVHHATISRRAT